MRKIEVEFVRRDIGALCHEAHVAQRAGIDDRLEIGRVEMLDILMGAFVDQVEQLGKTVAQVEATAATVTDIENAAQLRIEIRFVIKSFILPRDRVAGRGVQAAFAHRCSFDGLEIVKRPGPPCVAPAGYGPDRGEGRGR